MATFDRHARLFALGAILTATSLTGCGRPSQPAGAPAKNEPVVATGAPAPRDHAPREPMTFTEATLAEPPSEDQRVPPDTTMTGKSVGKLYSAVVKKWASIPLRSERGEWLSYQAKLETDQGDIVIALRPDLAPNHVRNFLALAEAGYYDGLVFERVLRVMAEDDPTNVLELIEGGCPLGAGDAGCGSIGYWMKPEFSPAIHEEGTVGAFHDEEQPDTAACKFYITLSKAPVMDGDYTVFGKVVTGIEVARRILEQPTRDDPAFPGGDRPVRPVVIRRVVIEKK